MNHVQWLDLPPDCLNKIFGLLSSFDSESCSLVCRYWLEVESQNRNCLSLNAKFKPDLITVIPSLFIRFNSVTTIALKSATPHEIGDLALVFIGIHCRYLTCLKLHSCRKLTAVGMAAFAVHCKGLKELYCSFCNFGFMGLNAVLGHCCSLEVLSLECFTTDVPLRPGVAANSLKTICINFCNVDSFFGQLIAASKNLTTLKISRCSGDLDKLFETPFITNEGLVSVVADQCKLLRELHIYGRKNKIGDKGLAAIARSCHNLEKLILYGVNATSASLDLLAANCQKLKRLAVGRSKTFGDAEISCIAAKCIALRVFCIWWCTPISDLGLNVLSSCCPPSLVNITISHCKNITLDGIDRLKADQCGSLAVNMDDQYCAFWDVVGPYFLLEGPVPSRSYTYLYPRIKKKNRLDPILMISH